MTGFLGDAAQPFYEEYPTLPPNLTLNGFMFALLGLYDLSTISLVATRAACTQPGWRR